MATEHTAAEKAYKKRTFAEMVRAILSLIRPGKHHEIHWDNIRAQAHSEIDDRIAVARSNRKTPEQFDQEWVDAENAKLRQQWEILRHGYSIEKDEFAKIILPIVLKLSFAPDESETGFPDIEVGDKAHISGLVDPGFIYPNAEGLSIPASSAIRTVSDLSSRRNVSDMPVANFRRSRTPAASSIWLGMHQSSILTKPRLR